MLARERWVMEAKERLEARRRSIGDMSRALGYKGGIDLLMSKV